ncbi:MAG TPA: TetR/AcrR family transcriptional regulator [Noviherbaspirillum sp.]
MPKAKTLPPVATRSRGRPVKSEADQAAIRNRILDAAEAAYAEGGYHELTVQAILLKAELSRPTFYRHFSNVDEPIQQVILRTHQGLLDRLAARIPRDASVAEKMVNAIDFYLDWCKNIGVLLKPFYNELHDPVSPVSSLRQDVLARIGDFYVKTMTYSGNPPRNRLLVDLMVTGIEYLGYRFYLETRRDAAALRTTRDAMLRLMACTFDNPEQWLRMLRRKKLID